LNQQVQVPTIEQLTQSLTQLSLQRSQAKDIVEQVEKAMAPLTAQLQLLQAQAAEAKASTDKD
jgi:phage shock protein A